MKVYTLTSQGTRLGKSYGPQGVSSYPMVSAFSSDEHNIDTIEDLHKVIVDTAVDGGCLIKGVLHRELHGESRAGATVATDPSQWVCFDLDKVEGIASPKEFMWLIGCADVAHIVQYSSSYGLNHDGQPYDKRLSCHVFMLLDREISAPLLKQWLIHLNFSIAPLMRDLSLTKSNVALSYGLDVTTCQNDKLLYIAPPECKAPFTDALKKKRITLVQGSQPYFVFPDEVNSLEQNRRLVQDMVNELRAAKGMEPRKKEQYKFVNSIEVMRQPGHSVVTSVKTERGFTYINLNGGNSWGYYHPEDNHEIIHNFKGEPNYLTKELVPDYYAALQGEKDKAKTLATEQANRGAAQAPSAQGEDQLYYLAFSELETGAYYRGFYDPTTNDVDIYPAKSETQVRHFLLERDIELGEFVPTWIVTYDPQCEDIIDLEDQFINLYRPSTVVPAPGNWLPIRTLISHVLGDPEGVDGRLTQHFIEWFRCIVQLRKCTTKAWVLQGVQGTGKGVLFNRVLKPILGERNSSQISNNTIMENANGWMQHTMLTMLDEAHLSTMLQAKDLNDKLKSWITEPTFQLREMYKGVRQATNYNNWIFASNHNSPVLVEASDRRFNVGYYQRSPWNPTDAELTAIDTAVPAFMHYLLESECDQRVMREVIHTTARDAAMDMSVTDTDYTVNKLLAGDWQYFWDLLPEDMNSPARGNFVVVDDYRAALVDIVQRANEASLAKETEVKVTRDEMFKILNFSLENIPASASNFTRWLNRKGAVMKKIKIHRDATTGIFLPIASLPELEAPKTEQQAKKAKK